MHIQSNQQDIESKHLLQPKRAVLSLTCKVYREKPHHALGAHAVHRRAGVPTQPVGGEATRRHAGVGVARPRCIFTDMVF